MAYLVTLVLDDLDLLNSILDAWEATGVSGITILRSTGIGRLRRASLRDDFPLMPSLHDLLRGRESNHRILFSVVENEEQVQTLVDATQSVIGDIDQPETGLLFVVSLYQVFGLDKPEREEEEQ